MELCRRLTYHQQSGKQGRRIQVLAKRPAAGCRRQEDHRYRSTRT